MPKIIAVVPTIRPESMRSFREAWAPLFRKHNVNLVTVWDGDDPGYELFKYENGWTETGSCFKLVGAANRDLFCRRTDAVRNFGFVAAAELGADFILTLDDDCLPMNDPNLHPSGWEVIAGKRMNDPIQSHLDALSLRVPLSWMNTAHCDAPYLRGVPYGVRDEAPVMLSHGVWVGTPDFDGETQLWMETCQNCDGWSINTKHDEKTGRTDHVRCEVCGGTGKNPAGVPKTLPYYVGPVPRGVLFPLCGMNVMVRKEALPYLYFAPMGADSGFPDLHRFADIWCGVTAKADFDTFGWAMYSGAATVLHTRASDAAKNCEQERLGRQWNEWISGIFYETEAAKTPGYATPEFWLYMASYTAKRNRFAALIRDIQEKP